MSIFSLLYPKLQIICFKMVLIFYCVILIILVLEFPQLRSIEMKNQPCQTLSLTIEFQLNPSIRQKITTKIHFGVLFMNWNATPELFWPTLWIVVGHGVVETWSRPRLEIWSDGYKSVNDFYLKWSQKVQFFKATPAC